MTENNLLKKLKSLKSIKPEDSWLKSNREILLAQIANSSNKELSPWTRLVIDARSFLAIASKPAISFASLLLVLVGASAYGHLAFSKTKPNDSLYIARIISEKAKLSTVFDTEEREKMEVRFATNHAEDITEVLATQVLDENNQDQLAKFNDSFNKEIKTVRTRIVALNKKVEPVAENLSVVTISDDENTLMTATSEKDDSGVQLAVNDELEIDAVTVATKTPAIVVDLESQVELDSVNAIKGAEEVLNEVQSLFDNKEYDSALNKLKEVKELMK
ncbi:MAG: hypothetical protein PHE20_01695 [Patescibacteria group bacterium]|nr:hypothetical protein [Patescibacteria group bacterium]